MRHVLGIGGIFFKAKDPEKLGAWYKKHLGLEVQDWGGVSFQEAPDLTSRRSDNRISFGHRSMRTLNTSRQATSHS